MSKKSSTSLLSFLISVLLLIFVVNVYAEEITPEEKSVFQSIAEVPQNTFVVPTIIDVPIELNNSQRFFVVTDREDIITASTMISNSHGEPLILQSSDSFGNGNAYNMVDDSLSTFTEFPFIEAGKDKKNRVQYSKDKSQNRVIIDVKANRSFRTDSLKLKFDKNIKSPTRIRIVAVEKDGAEQILLPEQSFLQGVIDFPEANSSHYRITLQYAKPLRVNDISFYEKGVPKTTATFVRFIAQPAMSYTIYYNATDHIKINSPESPNLTTRVPTIVSPEKITNNPFYKKADTDKDGVVDEIDNCLNTPNADQLDKDANGKGDACEDFDHDGITNIKDNCPNVANRSQIDTDFDGQGDKCDNEESRFMEKYPWLIYIILLIVFTIITGLSVRTFKQK